MIHLTLILRASDQNVGMSKNMSKKNTIYDYVILALIAVIPILSVLGFVMYFHDIKSHIIYNSIGIMAAVGITIILYIGIGLKKILYCIAYSCIGVGGLLTLVSFFSKTINKSYSIIVFFIGPSIYLLQALIYKKNTNKIVSGNPENAGDFFEV